MQLENCRMTFPNIDNYISRFEDLVRLAGYIVGGEETTNHFLKGLSPSIIDAVMAPPLTFDYDGIKTRAIDVTKARQMAEAIRGRHNFNLNQYQGGQCNQTYQPPFQRNYNNQTQICQPPPRGWNSSNAPSYMKNTPVPMDIGRSYAPNRNFGRNNQGQ